MVVSLVNVLAIADNVEVKTFRPVHGIAVVIAFSLLMWLASYALEGGLRRSGHQRVAPQRDGTVRIDITGQDPLQVRFFRFLNPANQEVEFFVARDAAGDFQVAFDANEVCFKHDRGYREEGEWVVCNWCDKAFRIDAINQGGGGCKPVPLDFQLQNKEMVIAEAEILKGWRFFR